MRLTRHASILTAVFLCTILASAGIVYRIEYAKYRQERERLTYITETAATHIQFTMNTLLQKTDTLGLLVLQNDGQVKNFEKIAARLLDDPAIRCLQLCPAGIVKYAYPLEGNEAAIGDDLFKNPRRVKEALHARNSGKLTMSGPFPLLQGGFGVIGRLPIFLTDSITKKETFWGFSVIVLNLPEAFDSIHLDRLQQEGYEYKLHRIHPDTNEIDVFLASSSQALTRSIDIPFELPNVIWTFSVVPREGWIQWRALWAEASIAVLLCTLLTVLAHVGLTLHRHREKFRQMAQRDELTGLLNFRGLHAYLNRRLSNSNKPFTLCYMDLNKFKSINDTFGHDCGDQLLKETASRINACLSGKDQLARIGGDEFVAVIEEEGDPQSHITQIRLAMQHPFFLAAQTVHTSISIGYAIYPQDGHQKDLLLKQADRRMYEEKHRGENTSPNA